MRIYPPWMIMLISHVFLAKEQGNKKGISLFRKLIRTKIYSYIFVDEKNIKYIYTQNQYTTARKTTSLLKTTEVNMTS